MCPVPFPLPKEWTKIQVAHERNEEGKYTMALSVEDQEVGRVDVDSQILRNLNDIMINSSYRHIIRKLIVLDQL